jgi:predicted phage terminase large subunit-like protein
MPQITAEGGAWDTAQDLYLAMGAHLRQAPALEAVFGSGAKVGFHHLQYEDTVHDWQSAQIALMLFDELTQFTRRQFFYMLSRNRSTCGVRPYVRAACNPDPDSWVREFIRWWIDDDTGLPIIERAGVLRWFARINDVLDWADSREELVSRFGPDTDPLSVTFIPASVYDNKALLAKDPGYLAKLKALPRWEREQLLGGNWNARAAAGMIFARSDFEIVDALPEITQSIRYWDRAATEQSESSPDPDWTAGVKISRGFDGLFYIEGVERFRERPLGVKTKIHNTASQDGTRAAIGIEQDPGQAGVAEAEDLVRSLAGYDVHAYPARQDKVTRWKPLSAQVQAGNVKLLRGPWNDPFIDELVALTDNPKDYGHDDQADAAAGGFNALTKAAPVSKEMASFVGMMRRSE